MKGIVTREGIICDYNCKAEARYKCKVCGRDICESHSIGIYIPYQFEIKGRVEYVCYNHVDTETLNMRNKGCKVRNPNLRMY
jgi:hypothetical protein